MGAFYPLARPVPWGHEREPQQPLDDRQRGRPRGPYAHGRADPPGAGMPRRAAGQARGAQPRREREGPDRRGDDRRRRGRGTDRARPHDDRGGHVGQHRNRAGLRVRGARVRARADHAPGDEPRAGGPAQAVRRRGAHHRVDGRHGRGGAGGPADRRRAGRRLHLRPVLQPGQPRDPPPHHGRGDLARRGRARGRAGGRGGHRRHRDRRGRAPEGAQPRSGGDRRGAGLLARAVGRAARPPPDPGHRRRLRALRAQPRRDRRGGHGHRRGRHRHGAPVRARRGRAGRDLLRRGAVGRDPGGLARGHGRQAPGRGPARLGERYVSTPFFAPS